MKYLQRSKETLSRNITGASCCSMYMLKFSSTFTITVPTKQKFVVTGNTKRIPGAIHTTKITPFLVTGHARPEFTVPMYNERTVIIQSTYKGLYHHL